MSGKNHPRSDTNTKKTMTPPAEEEAPIRPPHVQEGDVVMLKDRYRNRVALVLSVTSGRSASYTLVTPDGAQHRVAKPHRGRPDKLSILYGDTVTVVGHDREWLEAEKGAFTVRSRVCGKHARAANKMVREDF
jgi:hypothetical protein